MKLGNLNPSMGATKSTKRKGRGPGSGYGKTAGRGHKGSGQRSGYKSRPWFEGGQMPLSRRLPKRGFSNHLFKKEVQIVNLRDIENLNVDSVTAEILFKNGLVRSVFKPIKVLSNGNISKPLTITANAFSKGAKEKVEKAGGMVTVL
jgi:large subunit ribosomal protein L15